MRAFQARIASCVIFGLAIMGLNFRLSTQAIVFHISISRSAVQMRGFLMPFASS